MALNSNEEILAAVIEKKLYLIDLKSLAETNVEKPEVSARSLSFDTRGNLWILGFDGEFSQWNAQGQIITQEKFDEATDFTVMPITNHILMVFPDHIWEMSLEQ